MKKRILVLSLIFVLVFASLAGCGSFNTLKDGYYTAEMSDYSNGWKEYLLIQVKHGTIVSAEFNAKNESGFIKAWDNNYMQNMISIQGTYPNKYTREYVQQLLEGQGQVELDAVTGATTSGNNFKRLAEAVLKQAKAGDSKKIVVETAK